MRPRFREPFLAGLLAAGAAFAFHALLHPRVADPDSFYHVGHARLYASTSPLDTSFPWTAFSAVADAGADLWWGFHVLLIPFAGFDDLTASIRVAATALTLSGLGVVAWVAVRHRLLAAALWPLVFFLAVPNVLYRYLSVRPEVLSAPLALLLLSGLVRRQPLLVMATAAAITWLHLSMFWLAPALAGAWALALVLDTRPRTEARSPGPPPASRPVLVVAALLSGTLLGWLLRPNPLGAARLAWIQIAELMFEKTGGTPLTFGVELAPLDPTTLWIMAWPLLAPWALGTGWLLWSLVKARSALDSVPADERTHLGAALMVSIGFLGLTLLVARRSLVLWAAFATVSLALPLTYVTPPRLREAVGRALLLAVPVLFAHSLWRNALNVEYVAQPPDTLEEVATWLAARSAPGELVFNTHWDTFGPLFARNRVNRYVGGMDPIFQYARSPELYWSFHHLSTDQRAETTCATPLCAQGEPRDTYEVLAHDFGARWVLVEPRRNPRLSLYLLNDARYRLALETRREAVFEVLR